MWYNTHFLVALVITLSSAPSAHAIGIEPAVDPVVDVSVKTCTQAFDGDGLACDAGYVYSPASADLTVDDTTNFNSICCILIESTVEQPVDVVSNLLSCAQASVLSDYNCNSRRVYDITLNTATVENAADYDGACCRYYHCDEATDDPFFTCGAGRTYSTIADLTTQIITNPQFVTECCVDEEILCSEALLREDYVCGEGRQFAVGASATVVSGIANFDAACCRENVLCGQLLSANGDTCPEGQIYNPVVANAIISDGESYESTCCMDLLCANAALQDGYTCAGASYYNVASDATVVSSPTDFQAKCCMDMQCARAKLGGSECVDDRQYDPLADLSVLANAEEFDQTCCSDITCAQAVLSGGYTCAGVRVYNPLSDGTTLPGGAQDYDGSCCEDGTAAIELRTCTDVLELDGIMCSSGRIYLPASAGVEVENTADFDTNCCGDMEIEIPICAQALGVVGAVCLDGQVYNPLSATVPVPTLEDYSENCCQPKQSVDCNQTQIEDCGAAAGLVGAICLNGRVFDPLSLTNPVSLGLNGNFDDACCKPVDVDVRICAQGVAAGYACGDGQLYDPLKAGLLAILEEDFATTCCKNILNVETPIEVCSQGLGRGVFACSAGRVYNPVAASKGVPSAADYDKNCCMDPQVDVQVCSQGLGVLGYECPSGTVYNPLAANALVSRAGDFVTLCCEEDTECEPICNENAIENCVDALGLSGVLCDTGRAFIPALANVALNSAADFDDLCCDTNPNLDVDVCASVLGKLDYVCAENRVYSANLAGIIVQGATEFNEKCCAVDTTSEAITECVDALGVSGYSCGSGRIYDVANAAVSLVESGDFDGVCCRDDVSDLVPVCAQFIGVAGNSCGTGRKYNPLNAQVEFLGDGVVEPSFNDLCCEDIEGYNHDCAVCNPVCNEPGLLPTCFEALGLQGYSCGLDRVFNLDVTDLLVNEPSDFDNKCCATPKCGQALNLDGFICADAMIYNPDTKETEVNTKSEFNDKCCEADLGLDITLCGEVLGVIGYACNAGRVYDPLQVYNEVEGYEFDEACCRDALVVDVQLCAQGLGVSEYHCREGDEYDPLTAANPVPFSGDFADNCCKPKNDKVTSCLAVLGVTGFSCEANRKATMVSLSLTLLGPDEYDTKCCEDIGSGSYDPSLPDCPSIIPKTVILDQEPAPEPTPKKACSVAKTEDALSCSGQNMYDFTKKDVQVAGLSEFRSLCCTPKPCLSHVSKGRVLNVDAVCQRPDPLDTVDNGGAAQSGDGTNSTDSASASGADSSTTTSGETATGEPGATDTASAGGDTSGDSTIRSEPRMCKSAIEDLELCKDSLCTNVGIDPESPACVCNGEFEVDPYCSACTVNGCDQCVASAEGVEVYRPRTNDQFGLEDNLGLTTPLVIGRWCVLCAVHNLAGVFECTKCEDNLGCIAGLDLVTGLPVTLSSADNISMKWAEEGTRSYGGVSGPNWGLLRCDGTEDAGVCFEQQSYNA